MPVAVRYLTLPAIPPPLPPLSYLSINYFCCVGDVNAIADTVIHAQIYKYLIDLHEILVRIRANQAGYFFLKHIALGLQFCFKARKYSYEIHEGYNT